MAELLTIKCEVCKSELKHTCSEDLRANVIRLFSWRPEVGFPVPELDEETEKEVDHPEMPFMCETFLYPLLGKEDARTLMALVNNVIRAVGLDPYEMQTAAWKELDTKTKLREEREEHHRKLQEKRRAKK